jgi:hypothetical protein
MNKELRNAFKCNSWSKLEGFLEYLRAKECFEGIRGQKNASPYWYGTVLCFNEFENEIRNLIANKSIKPKRLKQLFLSAKEETLSPIVRLVGISGLRIFFDNNQ